ncbi:MAG TPA: hypothetical protein VFK21_01370, partial [Gammaproteobacteria bacterium]|nr:hypothetical protein [Gammaproteobacteria bacterium]
LSWSTLSRAAFSFQAGITMRPISMLSFALNEYIFGSDRYYFKLINLVIHILNGLLVCVLLLQLLSAYRRWYAPATSEERIQWLAIVTGGLWLLHPLNLMPVLYVVQRETSLSSFFVLVGCNVYAWVRIRRRENRSGAWALWSLVPLLTLVAIFCKESGALLPVYLLAIEYFFFRFRGPGERMDRQAQLFYLPMLVLPMLGAGIWIVATHGGPINYGFRDFTLGERLMSEARIVWLYIRWTYLPDPASLGLYHDDISISHGLLQPATTLLSILGLAGIALAGFVLRRRLPIVVFGIAWFFAGQLMESTVFPLELAYEHRCYLPDLGLLIALTSVIYPLESRARYPIARYGLLGMMLGITATLTFVRAYDWRDNLSFAANEAKHHPASVYATYMLGQTYANLALFGDGSQYQNAVDSLNAASAVPNSGVIPDVSLILVEAQLKGEVDPAILKRIASKLSHRRITASDIQGLNALTDCADRHNCRLPADGMRTMFESALSNPETIRTPGSHANVLVIYGNYISAQPGPGHLPQARTLMAQAAELVPTESQYRANLVTLDLDMGDLTRARADLDSLRKLNYLGHLDTEIADYESEIERFESTPQP